MCQICKRNLMTNFDKGAKQMNLDELDKKLIELAEEYKKLLGVKKLMRFERWTALVELGTYRIIPDQRKPKISIREYDSLDDSEQEEYAPVYNQDDNYTDYMCKVLSGLEGDDND